jgi:hypothetical protein
MDRTTRDRVARVLLFAGLGGAVFLLGRAWPRDTELVLRLEGDRTALARVEVTVRSPAGEELGGASWTFPTGKAPPTLRTTVHSSPGDCDVTLDVQRSGIEPAHERRRLRLEGGAVTLPVTVP